MLAGRFRVSLCLSPSNPKVCMDTSHIAKRQKALVQYKCCGMARSASLLSRHRMGRHGTIRSTDRTHMAGSALEAPRFRYRLFGQYL